MTPEGDERVVHHRPDSLRDEIKKENTPTEMREAFAPKIERIRSLCDNNATETVAVQGAISSMKTWLMVVCAEALLDAGKSVTIFAPQKGNRSSIADRLGKFGVPYIERPARLDLCVWDDWRESVGYVDEAVCANNGCSRYPDSADLDELAREAIGLDRLYCDETALQIGQNRAEGLADMVSDRICPFYLTKAIDDHVASDEAVRVATTAKAFANAAGDGFGDADVVLVDETHTVAGDVDRVIEEIDIDSVCRGLEKATDSLHSGREKAIKAANELRTLHGHIEVWVKDTERDPLELSELFSSGFPSPGQALGLVDEASTELIGEAKRQAASSRWDAADRAIDARRALGDLYDFLTAAQSWAEEDRDFVHVVHEAGEGVSSQMYLQRVENRQTGCSVADIYEAWQENGTHPAIKQRWGGLLEQNLSKVWEGRSVDPSSMWEEPQSVLRPLDVLREITNAGTLVGFSATHNELSDPARSPDENRDTRHRLTTAPLQLRSDGDSGSRYQGDTAVDAETPWFREIVCEAQDESGTRLVAVPINSGNAEKWKTMPVQELKLPDVHGESKPAPGLVPHSRGAVGAKDLEVMDVDAVLCGVQVQSPLDTIYRLISYWEMVAPEHEDPEEALAESWRLLAQHAVSGTIQAGGRFPSDTTNLIFERADLLELAGYEHSEATAEDPGFTGAFVKEFSQLNRQWMREQGVFRAKRVVRSLENDDTKRATSKQFTSRFTTTYEGTTRLDAREAFFAAEENGEMELVSGELRLCRGAKSEER